MDRRLLALFALLGCACASSTPAPSEPEPSEDSGAPVVIEADNPAEPAPTCAPVDSAGLAHLYPAAFTRVSEVETGIERELILVDGGVSPASEGRYLLLDERGPLTLASVSRQRGEGPVQVELDPIEPWLRDPPPRPGESWSHQVLVGPLAEPLPCAKLMFVGLARAGASAERAPEPGTRAFPRGEPVYAVDLDGDDAADLALYQATVAERSYGDEVELEWEAQTFVFRDGAWVELDSATWTTRDYYGPL